MMKSRLFLVLLSLGLALTVPATAQAKHDKLRVPPGTETEKKEDRVVGEDKKMDNRVYKPDYCDFYAAFPSEPLKGRRCETDDDSKCYDLVSFTKVFGLSSTVRIDIICNPGSEELYQQYTPDVMKKTVSAMMQGNAQESYEPQVREEENYRQAGTIGQGRAGMGDSIYIAQLWIGKHSIMAVEAELMGEQTEEADSLFASILKTIGYQGPAGEEDKDGKKADKEAKQDEKTKPSGKKKTEDKKEKPGSKN
ncbi:MAG: hypothetical protein KDI65_12520 [Alphaproteobacteria bacterium]|nr:hypothetical protein [Alphaproteobacteria bacterium]